MSDIRSNTAILLLDVTEDLVCDAGFRDISSNKETLSFIDGELSYFRERMRPVIFCNTQPNKTVKPSILSALRPRVGEIVISKPKPNAFFETELLSILKKLKISNITIVGGISHCGVILTAASALDNNFVVVVPETCTFGLNDIDHNSALRLLQQWLKSQNQQKDLMPLQIEQNNNILNK